jgi:hypothetical protein
MTVASFFRKYSVGCILNYVRLIITREISCIYIYSYSCSSVLRSVRSQHNVQSRAINFGRQGHSLTQSKMLHCKTVVNVITYHHVV